MIPLVPETRTPASNPSEMIEIDLVIVTPPKPPGSRTLISPPAAVLLIAPANVLHGAVRLHGLASSPTPEIQVRVAWAPAGIETERRSTGIHKLRGHKDMAFSLRVEQRSPGRASARIRRDSELRRRRVFYTRTATADQPRPEPAAAPGIRGSP